jgi:hypothetical protein
MGEAPGGEVREGEAPAELGLSNELRLGRSLELPFDPSPPQIRHRRTFCAIIL